MRLGYIINGLKWQCIYNGRLKYSGRKPIFMKGSKIKIGPKGIMTLGSIRLNENAFICCSEGKVVIEDNVTINRNSIIVAKCDIHIGQGTSIGPNVCIYDHDHAFDEYGFKKTEYKKENVSIGNRCWVGGG